MLAPQYLSPHFLIKSSFFETSFPVLVLCQNYQEVEKGKINKHETHSTFVLMSHLKCYECFINMYLQVCKYRSFLIAASIVDCCQIQYTNACEQVLFVFKTENKHKCIEFDSACDCK